jgi:hypothetical protein
VKLTQGYCYSDVHPIVPFMTTILELIAIVAPLVGVAYASQRWGAEQRPGFGERRPDGGSERWAIR